MKSSVTVFALEVVVTSSSLYQLSSGQKCLLSALLGILRLSQTYVYACFTHLTPCCGRILKLLRLILTLIAVGQMLTASLLLSQGCGLSCSLQSLSDPQFWSSFLPVFTSYLLMPPLAIGVVHTGSRPHSTYWEPIHCQGIPSGLRAHFLMESTAHLIGSVSRIAPLRVLSATILASPHSPAMQHRTQFFGWGEKEVGFFGSSLRSLLTHSDFVGEITS